MGKGILGKLADAAPIALTAVGGAVGFLAGGPGGALAGASVGASVGGAIKGEKDKQDMKNKVKNETQKANAKTKAATEKAKQKQKSASAQGFKETNKVLDTLQPKQDALVKDFTKNQDANVKEYEDTMAEAIAEYTGDNTLRVDAAKNKVSNNKASITSSTADKAALEKAIANYKPAAKPAPAKGKDKPAPAKGKDKPAPAKGKDKDKGKGKDKGKDKPAPAKGKGTGKAAADTRRKEGDYSGVSKDLAPTTRSREKTFKELKDGGIAPDWAKEQAKKYPWLNPTELAVMSTLGYTEANFKKANIPSKDPKAKPAKDKPAPAKGKDKPAPAKGKDKPAPAKDTVTYTDSKGNKVSLSLSDAKAKVKELDSDIKSYESKSDTLEKAVEKAKDSKDTFGIAGITKESEDNIAAFEKETEKIGEETATQVFEFNQKGIEDGSYAKMAADISAANQKIATDLIKSANPAWENQKRQAAVTNSQMMAGVIPADVAAQIARAGAQKSLLSGALGGNLQQNLTARDFGLTSIDLINQGQKGALEWQKQISDETLRNMVGVQDIINTQGLNVNSLLPINQQNKLASFNSKQALLDTKLTGLNNVLTTKTNTAINVLNTKNQTDLVGFNTKSGALNDTISGRVGAITDRTNVELGIAAQGLSNDFTSAARNLQAGLVAAQNPTSPLSTFSNVLTGAVSAITPIAAQAGAFDGLFKGNSSAEPNVWV